MRRWRALVGSVAAAAALGWLDPSAVPREAARLYAEGKFDDAAAKYNQALIDAPDSTLLHFNLGDAEYRRKKYDEALRAFGQVPDDPAAQYNQGNALFRAGEGLAGEKPEEALAKWAEALVAYRRAIAADPADEDAKFNYEWVTRKIEELEKKHEEQQQQQQKQQDQDQQQDQDEQQDENQQQNQDQDQQNQEEQQKEQQEPQQDGGEQGEPPPPDDQQQAGQQPQAQPSQPQPEPQDGEAAAQQGELSREEAQALLDGQEQEELRPEDVIRRQLGAGEAAVQDW